MRNYVILSILSALIGAFLSRTYFTREVITTKTQVVDRTVVVTHTVVAKDGTKTIDSTITDDKKQNETIVDKKASPAPKWSVSALYGTSITHKVELYGTSVTYQILGPIEVGAWGLTNGSVGVQIGVRF